MDTKALRQKILDLAIRGKLVPQDPNDEPASVLLERIRAEKQQMVKDGKLKAKDIKNDTVIFKGDDNLHYEQFADGTVKCIEDEIPFELPEGWAWARINTACIVNPRNNIDDNTEVSFVPMANISEGYANSFVSDSRLWCKVKTGYTHFAENDIGIAKITPCFENRKSVVFTGLINGYGAGTTELHIIRTITGLIMPEYLLCFAKRNDFILGGVQTFSGDVGQQRVTKDYIANYLFSLPPLNEQKRIISAIKEAYYIIENIEKTKLGLIEDIDKAKSKILDLAIRGKLVPQDPNDEPASVLLERIRAEKEELIKQGKIKRDKKESVIFKGDDNSYYRTNGKTIESCDNLPFDLPEGWIWTSLGQYCEKVTDQVASGSFAALRENVVSLKEPSYALMVKTADFSNGFTKNLTYTDKHGYEFLENSNLFGGELILSNIGSIGKVFIVPDLNCKMTLAPNSVMIRLTNNEYRDYLYYFLQSPTGYEELKAISTGVAMLKFNKTDLKTIYLPSPPLAEQKRIVEAIETAFAQIDKIAEQIS